MTDVKVLQKTGKLLTIMLSKPNQIFLSNGKHPSCRWRGGTRVFPRGTGTQSGAYLGQYVETLPWNIFQFWSSEIVFSSILRNKLEYFDEIFFAQFL